MTQAPTPQLLAVDLFVADWETATKVLAIRRKNEPFQNCYALPGGFVDPDETVEDAARRELKEETGLVADRLRLIGVYSDPRRDPRGRVVSFAFIVNSWSGELLAGDDAASAEWLTWKDGGAENRQFAFDHDQIIRDGFRIRMRDY